MLVDANRPNYLRQLDEHRIAEIAAEGIEGGGVPRLKRINQGTRFRFVDETQTPLLDGEDFSALEVIIVDSSPFMRRSYYAGTYESGSKDAPDCYSQRGDKPSDAAKYKQHATCALCPKDAWGSADKGKGKACKSFKDIVIMAPKLTGDALFVLDIPPTSLKSWAAYVGSFRGVNLDLHQVKTEIRFDLSDGKLLRFRCTGYISENEAGMVGEALKRQDTHNMLRLTNITSSPIALSPPTPASMPSEPRAIAKPVSVAEPPAGVQDALRAAFDLRAKE